MIVGVAVKFGDHIEIRLPKPNRHSDCFELFFKTIGKREIPEGMRVNGDQQGFYTHSGKFLNRKQAYKYAIRVKQPRVIIERPGALVSEHLW